MAKQGEAQVKLTLVDRLTAPLNRIKARLATLGKNLGLDRIGVQLKNVGSAFANLGDGLARSAMRLATTVTALSAAVAGIAAGAFKIANDTAELGANLKESSTKLGIDVESLQQWRYAAKMSAVDGEQLDKAIAKLGVNASASVKGNKAMAKSFKALGINVKDTNGKMKPTEKILEETMNALADMKDPLRRNELAMKLFGKSGVELAKMMGDGSKGIKDLREEAVRTGNVLSDETASLGDSFGDNLDKLKEYVQGLKNTLGAALLPVMNDVVVKITEWVDANRELIKQRITEWVARFERVVRDLMDPTSELRKNIDDIAAGFAKFGDNIAAAADAAKPFVDFVGGPLNAALLALGTWILAPTITAIATLTAAFAKLGAVMLTTPFGWIVIGAAMVGAAIYVLYQKWDEFLAYWGNLWGRIKTAFDSSWTEGIEATLKEFNPLVHIARGWNAVFEYFTGINLINEGTRIMKSLGEGISAGLEELRLDIWEAWVVIAESHKHFVGKLFEAGSALAQAIWDGLKAKWEEMKAWLSDAIANLVPDWSPDWLKERLGIRVDGKPGADGKTPPAANDNAKPGVAPDDSGWFLKTLKDALGRASHPLGTVPDIITDIVNLEPAKVEVPKVTVPEVKPPLVSSVISLQDAIRAREAGIGGSTTDTLPGKTKDDLGMGPQSINPANMNVGSITMPEPIVAHEPQQVNAPFSVNLTINAQGDANSIAGAVQSALAAQAAKQAAAVKSSLSD